MVKKIIIVILLVVALFLVIFQPAGLSVLMNDLAKEMNYSGSMILTYVIAYYVISSTLLFWIGISAGWSFARDLDWGLIAVLIAAYIGMLLSLPIALFQLFRPQD